MVAVADDTLWVSSLSQVTALDPAALTVEAGFPKSFEAASCDPLNALFLPLGMYCLHAGGTASEGMSFFQSHELNFSKNTELPSPLAIGGSTSRIFVSYGDGTTIAVLDATGTPVVGSPFMAETNGPVFEIAASDALNRVALSSDTEVKLFDRTTFVTAGGAILADSVASMVMDDADHSVVVSMSSGKVASLNAGDGSIKVAEVERLGGQIAHLVLDRSRNRIYGIGSTTTAGFGKFLIVLDATTLEHVPGSPVALPSSARSVTFY